MRGIVHIGTEKTGTTSFQAFMHKNRGALKNDGIFYPSELGGENHRFLATYGLSLETADDSFRHLGISNEAELQTFYELVETRIDAQLKAATDARVCVFSSEHLHSRLKNLEQLERIRQVLSGYFDELEVHIHLRPQVDVLVSLASTQTRVGGAVGRGFFNRATADNVYYNYNSLVGMWEDAFGADHVYCVPFKEKPDYLGFVADRVDINLDQLPKADRVNEAIDIRVMAMVNALVESGSGQRIDFRVIDRLPVNEKLMLDNAFARQIQHRFEESNRALIARRDELKPGQLQPNWARYPEQGNLELLDQSCVFSNALADLIAHYNCVIKAEAVTK